ncbi:MAG: hypothetical protein CIT01_03815 [Methanobacterium sp. BRmetb2]|jgi:hypothetical protein|nr:MAG: hypothetical protein CIT01_03815 [Methanobacterium sp. BRmetb2]
MDITSLNLIHDSENDLIFGNPINIGDRVLIPLIEIFRIKKRGFLTCSINPSAILSSERLKSKNCENTLIILMAQEESDTVSNLINFIDSKKSFILDELSITIDMDKLKVIYPLKEIKNEEDDNKTKR